MLSSIFESLMIEKHYERYDGVNEVLVMSNDSYELKITKDMFKLDRVKFNPNLLDPHHGIPVNRENVAVIDYNIFLSSNYDEILGISREDINAVITYYRSLG